MSEMIVLSKSDLQDIVFEAARLAVSEVVKSMGNNGTSKLITLAMAAEYTGFSTHYLRRLAVEQKKIIYSRPSGPKGNLFFHKKDLDAFLSASPRPKLGGRRSTKEAWL